MIPEAAPASKPTDVPAKGWKEIAKETWKEGGKDHVEILAAGVAFYAFTALVPLLTAFVLTYGLVAEPSSVVSHMQMLTSVMPQESAGLIGEQLKSMVDSSGGKTGFALLLALAIALYGASKGATSVMTALNMAYGTTETRGFIKRTLMAIGMVAGVVIVLLLVILAMSAANFIEHLLPAFGGVMHVVIQILSFVLAAGAVLALLAIIYRYGPNRPNAKWAWVTPGSILATIVWLLATVAFGFYVSNFGSYNATYGSLGAVIVFLTWLYLSAYIVLLGAEMNAVLEQEVAENATSKKAEKQGAGAQAKSAKQPQPKGEAAGSGIRPQPASATARTNKPEEEPEPSSAVMLALKFGAAALASKVLGTGSKTARKSSPA